MHSPRRRQSCSLSAAELATLGRATRCAAGLGGSGSGTLVLVAEYQSALFQIVRRHLNSNPVARERLDPVLFHLAGGVGDDLVPCVQLDTIAGIGEDFGDQSFELD